MDDRRFQRSDAGRCPDLSVDGRGLRHHRARYYHVYLRHILVADQPHGPDVSADGRLSPVAVAEASLRTCAAPNRRRLTMQHPIVSRDEWLTARRALLKAEKEVTHLRDKLAQERLALPWVRIEKEYVFATPEGP